MRILFYVEPLVERERPFFKLGWLNFVARFQAALAGGDNDLACVLGDALLPKARELLPGMRLAVVRHAEIVPSFARDPNELAKHWYLADAGDETARFYGALLRTKLCGFEPDVCITLSPAPFLRAAFPNAAVLHFEYGMLSRTPFPETAYLDPFGMFNAGALRRFSAEILRYSPSARERTLVDTFRSVYAPRLFGGDAPLARLVRPQLESKRSSVLVALQFSDHYGYDAHARFRSQYDLLEHTLEVTPHDIAVVACEHPEHPIFDRDTLSYLRQRHPHLVWEPEFRSIYAASQQLVGLVDGVVTVSSSVGVQALLWRKRLFILGTSHLDDYADGNDLHNVATKLRERPRDDLEGVVAWLLARYYTPFSLLFDPLVLTQKLESALDATPERDGFAWFKPVAPSTILQRAYTESPTTRFVSPVTKPSEDPSLLNVALYSRSTTSGYAEETCMRHIARLGSEPASVRIMTPEYDDAIVGLRLDLSERPATFFVNDIIVRDDADREIWRWDRDAELLNRGANQIATAAAERGSVLLECLTVDPHFELPAFPLESAYRKLTVELSISAAAMNEVEALKRARQAHEIQNVRLGERMDALARNAAAALGEALQAAGAEANGKLTRLANDLAASTQAISQSVREGGERAEVSRTEIDVKLTRLANDLAASTQAISQSVREGGERAEVSRTETDVKLTRLANDLAASTQAISQSAHAARAAAEANSAADRIEVARLARDLAQQLAELTVRVAASSSRISASQESQADIANKLEALRAEELLAFGITTESIAAIKSELRDLRDAISAGQADKSEQEAMLQRYHGLLHDLESVSRHAGTLEQELDEVRELARQSEAHRREIDALRASSSWRITGPIRAAKLAVQRLFGARHDGRPFTAPATSAPAPRPPTDTLEAPRFQEIPSSHAVEPPGHLTALYVPFKPTLSPPWPAIRAIAFYLPQYHPIPENDAWWGRGFTEWTNVTKASPQYIGHYQPHLPDELGFYDLRVPAVQERQAELAKIYGVSAFCFYFYWFAGKRLLETPILQWLHNPNITMPFCLCWANENWSRRWDGLDAELLIGQEHSPEDDIAFISHIAQYLRDPRYVRINGKPLLLVYRPSLLPDPRATAQRWRQWCRDHGVGEIHLTLTQSFDVLDPHEYGFDAAVEFPPNNMGPPDITDQVEKLNPDFGGTIYDYDFYVERSAHFPERPYTVFRGTFPSWDNEARRLGRGVSFHGATPEKFRRFVRNAAGEALKAPSPDERIVFINAWNEWAEGAHLEPDRRYGYAWLEALRQGLEDVASPRRARHLTLVVHDAYRHGAQYLALNMARVFSRDLGFELDIVILGDGPLKPEFATYGAVHDMVGVDPRGPVARQLAKDLKAKGTDHAICNTTVTGLFLQTLSDEGVACIALIHELPGVIGQYGLREHLRAIWGCAKLTVYPSTVVRDKIAPPAERPAIVRTQGLYKRNGARTADEQSAARRRLRAHFNLPADTEIVISVAYGDHRKGIDLWPSLGQKVIQARPNAVFLWAGEIEASQRDALAAAVTATGLADRFLFPGFQSQTDDFYAGADVYALLSREDPFPTVIMESLDVGVPVVAFDGAGGFSDLLRSGVGVLAPMDDLATFAGGVVELLSDRDARHAMGDRGRETVRTEYSFRRYCFDLARYVGADVDRVSVVVPNYNYAQHLNDRFNSVLNQGFPIYELIVLDDRSTDDSVAVAQGLLTRLDIDWSLHVNPANSGSPCRQWLNGAAKATGDFVWIAEADDLTLPGFLEATLPAFRDPEVAMSYCQSQQMAGDGSILCPHYLDYVADIDADKWLSDHIAAGRDEIRAVLAVKNTIPNVSACVFRRDALVGALEAHIEEVARYRVAGDWATYVRVLERGKIAFTTRALNLHRRHERSVTVGSFDEKLLHEILSMQRAVRERFGTTPKADAIARAYAQELYVQFGLANPAAPQVFANPAFATYRSGESLAAE